MPKLEIACQAHTFTDGVTNVYLLAGAPGNARNIADVFVNGQEHAFYIADKNDFELIRGRFSALDNTIDVLEVIESSNADAAVAWRTGQKIVSAVALPDDFLSMDNAIETATRVVMTASERTAVNRYATAADPFYWKPKGHALFGGGSGQSNIEPAFPMQPGTPPLVASPNVLVWCSDGEGGNWDFRVADPSLPLFNDYQPYHATNNPNGRGAEPYSGYPSGGNGLATLGAALEFHEQTGRKVYFWNTAWSGQHSSKWKPGVGECALQIDSHMPAMIARLAELEPELEVFTWDFLLINQGAGNMTSSPVGYADDWEEWLDDVSAFTLDGSLQEVPSKWMDRRRTLVAWLQRAKRDSLHPTWNGQEILQRRRKSQITLVPSARRPIFDTEGLSIHFWGDAQTDFGRDAARMLLARGAGPEQNQVDFLKHADGSKPIAGVYTYVGNVALSDPGVGNVGLNGFDHVMVNKTDANGLALELADLSSTGIFTLINRADPAVYWQYSSTTPVVDHGAYWGFPITAIPAVEGTIGVGHGIDLIFDARLALPPTSADIALNAPYKRLGIGHSADTMPNATVAIKAHDVEGLVLDAESQSAGSAQLKVKLLLQEALNRIHATFSAALNILIKGATAEIDVLDQATGETRNAVTITPRSNTTPRIELGGPLTVGGECQVLGDLKSTKNSTVNVFAEKKANAGVAPNAVIYGAQTAHDNATAGNRNGAPATLQGGAAAANENGDGGDAVLSPGAGAGTGKRGKSLINGAIYGQILAVFNATPHVVTSTATILTSCWTANGLSNDITPDEANGKLIAATAGTYKFNSDVSCLGTASKKFIVGVYRQGEAFASSAVELEFSATPKLENASIHGSVALTAGQDITLRVLSQNGGTSLTVKWGQLSMERMSD